MLNFADGRIFIEFFLFFIKHTSAKGAEQGEGPYQHFFCSLLN
jgi:hypothetical protein